MVSALGTAILLASSLLFTTAAAQSGADESDPASADVQRLLEEMERMRLRLDEMDALRERVRILELELEEERRAGEVARAEPAPERRDVDAASDAAEAEAAAADDQDEPDEPDGVAITGALRFTGFHR